MNTVLQIVLLYSILVMPTQAFPVSAKVVCKTEMTNSGLISCHHVDIVKTSTYIDYNL